MWRGCPLSLSSSRATGESVAISTIQLTLSKEIAISALGGFAMTATSDINTLLGQPLDICRPRKCPFTGEKTHCKVKPRQNWRGFNTAENPP